MKRLAIVLLALASACLSSSEPQYSLAGTWVRTGTELVLTDDHGLVSGHAYVISALLTGRNTDTLGVNGIRSGPSFQLTLTAGDGSSSSYTGQRNGNQLTGILASSSGSDSVAFTRQ